MKCNQSRPGFELVSPCSFPTAITTTPRAPPLDWNGSCNMNSVIRMKTNCGIWFCILFSFNPSYRISFQTSSIYLSIYLSKHIYLNIYIIKSSWLHGVSWFSHHPLLSDIVLVSLVDYIKCSHKAYVSLWWSANVGVSMCRTPSENAAYEFVLTSLLPSWLGL